SSFWCQAHSFVGLPSPLGSHSLPAHDMPIEHPSDASPGLRGKLFTTAPKLDGRCDVEPPPGQAGTSLSPPCSTPTADPWSLSGSVHASCSGLAEWRTDPSAATTEDT